MAAAMRHSPEMARAETKRIEDQERSQVVGAMVNVSLSV
jgi:hypothetical protein